MKYFAVILSFGIACHSAAREPRVVPPSPPLTTFTEKAKEFNVILILAIDKTTKPATYKIQEILHGKAEYRRFKDSIEQILPKPPHNQSLLPDYEVVFVKVGGSPTSVRGASTFALYAARTETDGIMEFNFQAHSIDAVKTAIADGRRQAEEAPVQPPPAPTQK